MGTVKALAYFVAQSTDIFTWKKYAEQILGASDKGGSLFKRFGKLLAPIVLALLGSSCDNSSQKSAASISTNTNCNGASTTVRPITIPALREWQPGPCNYSFTSTSRIVATDALRAVATTLAEDIGIQNGRAPAVTTTGARPGDIVLALGPPDAQLGPQGYDFLVDSKLTITAPTDDGIFNGTRTLLQLLHQNIMIPGGAARDWPRYPERGLMLDIARRKYSLAFLEAYVRELAYLKLNLLHLHFTDNEAWVIESTSHPEVVSADAFSKAQIQQLIALARRYHVEIIPEVEFPGHAGSIVAAHPDWELSSPARSAAGYHALDISKPEVRSFARDVIEEYLPLFPGRYWHTGGDEYLSPAEYSLYPQLLLDAQQRYGLGASVQDEINGFLNEINSIVTAHGKTLRVWNDSWASGSVVQVNADILSEWWTRTSPLGQTAPLAPATLLAGNHSIFNAGWYPTYYTGDLGPLDGAPDPGGAYESWNVNVFCSAQFRGTQAEPCESVPQDATGNLGAAINVWGLPEVTDQNLVQALFPRLRMIAQKTWDSPQLTSRWAEFQPIMDALGEAPGFAPY